MRITERHDAETVQAHHDSLNSAQFDILMAAAENPSYDVIAAKLSIGGGTVRSRLYRARMVLSQIVAEKAAKAAK